MEQVTSPLGVVVALTLLMIACGGTDHPASPTSPGRKTATLTFHVYNSATGEIAGAGFTRTVETDCCGQLFPAVSIALSDLRVEGVDPQRAVLRTRHQGNTVGALIAKTVNGTLAFQPLDSSTYDLFLMNATSGLAYSCLDYTAEAVQGAASAFPTMHRYTTGTIFDCPVEDGPDEPFQIAADQFNEALNPFGVRYGYIDYRGADGATGLMTAGWTAKSACKASMGGGGTLIVQQDAAMTALRRAVLVIHELGHAYLGAPDYFKNTGCFSGNLTCAFLDCPQAAPTFMPAGKDAARYWALMDSRMRGRSAQTR